MDPKFNWESDKAQTAKESVEKLVKLFLHVEQWRWIESSSPVERTTLTNVSSCCNGSQTATENHSKKTDPGFKILRHGKNVKHIHAYFQNLEPHRYRLKLTAGNKVLDRPDSSIRVLQRGESRIEKHLHADRGVSVESIEQSVLTDKDLQIYEMAILCYQAPYLSAPPVPSPYSPSSSPTSPSSPHQFEFSYSPPPRANVHSPFQSKAFTFSSSKTSPETTLPASSSAMKELVRRSYGFTKHIHSTREKQLKEKMMPKNGERVLVEDLMTQLYLLNNNCHPYYRIQSFLDKNGYDEWVTAEKEHINRLIKVFWHFPLPPCTSAYPLNQFDAHEGYVMLMKRFIRYESANRTSHSVFGDITPTAPLSLAACRLLKEFGLRYGVGELYRKLVYLKYLVNHFECEVWIIQHVTVLVEEVMNLVTITPEIYVKEECVMLLEVLTLLLRLSKYYLTRVTRLFPKNSPPGGVTSLVAMAELVQDASLYLREKFPSVFSIMMMRVVVNEFLDNLEDEPFDALLAGCLKKEVIGRYERFKVIAAYKLEVGSYDPPLTPNLLNILIYDIQEEITIYKTDYQVEFERYIDFVQIASVTFYELLMADVQEMCLQTPSGNRNKVDLRMLALAYRLSILDRDMASYLSLSMQTWREPLLELSLTWLDIVGRHLKQLIPALLQKEPWRAVEIARANDQSSSNSRTSLASNVLKITSKEQQFTQSCNSAFRKVTSDQYAKPSGVISVSNPNLTTITSNVGPSHDSIITSNSDSTLMNSTRKPKSDFKGKTIVTQATVNVPRRTETMSSVGDGLSKSCHIENLFFQNDSTSSSSGNDIQKIDQSEGELDAESIVEIVDRNSGQTGETSQTGKSGKTDEELSETGPSGKSSLTGIDVESEKRKTEIATNSAATGQAENAFTNGKLGQTQTDLETSQTSQTGLEKEGGENQYSQTGLTSLQQPKEDQNQVISLCKSLVNDLVSNLTAPATDQTDNRGATPYENEDDAASGSSSDYKTAESSPDSSNVKTNKSNRSFDLNVDQTSSTEHASVGANSLNVVDGESTVESRSSNVENHHSTFVESKNPLPSKGEMTSTEGKTSESDCENCPNKFKVIVTDIEEITKAPKDLKQPSVDDWNRPGPSGLQPIKIANKHLALALDTDVTSEYGSVPSRVTVTSYETAPQNSSDQTDSSDESTIYSASSDSLGELGNLGEDVTPSLQQGETRIEVLPISSSAVDLLCCVNRLLSFTCHLCSILCPNESTEIGDGDDERREALKIKTSLCGKLVQICKELVLLYTDCLLAVETCGMTDSDLMSIVGARATRDIVTRCMRDGVSGCRFNPNCNIRCNMANEAGEMVEQCRALTRVKQGVMGCETASSKMGIRNSDIVVIESLLSWLHDHITLSLSCHKSVGMGFYGNGAGCGQLSYQSEVYCQNGPSVESRREDSLSESQQQHKIESHILSQSIDESLDECSTQFHDTSDIQCQLIAHRINDLFSQILHQLLNLSLPTFDTKKRLQPIIDFLHNRLKSLRRVMFPDTFLMTLKHLWRHVVQDFTTEIELLKERRTDSSEQAVLLLNSMAYLMEFFHGYGRGIGYDELIQTTETVTKHIELYTTPTARLIRLYGWLYDQMLTVRSSELGQADEFTSSVGTSSHHSQAHAPADYLIQSIRLQLHAKRKCFSGTDFVNWVRHYVREHGYDSLGVCIGISDTETGIELGQYLLERNFLTCVTFKHVANDDSDDEEYYTGKGKRSRLSKGTVFVNNSNALSSQMRFNDISITKTSPSRPTSSKSSSRPASSMSTYSSSIESEGTTTRDLLDSVDVILRQAGSNQSVASFQNSPNVYYSFLIDSDGSGGEFKYKLDFNDRFSIRLKLEQIICVLYTRKKKDVEAKQFLRRLPKEFIAHALGYKETPWCFYI